MDKNYSKVMLLLILSGLTLPGFVFSLTVRKKKQKENC